MLHGTRIASDESAFDLARPPQRAAGEPGNDGLITVPDAHLLFNGDFQRHGSDLKIVGEDGKTFLIPGYFKGEKNPTLLSPEGASLTGDIVEALAGPLAPGQYAQAGQQASDQPAIGRVEQVAGNATIVRNGVAIAANQGDVVRKGDVVQTGGDGMIAVLFADGSTFSLSASARMVLNDFVYQAGGANNSALISLVQGTIGFVAGQVAKTGDMRVETPVATMGIRGTAVLVEITANNGQTKFSVLVEPDGTTGSFNLYDKSSGALLGTVNNSQVGWVVTPAGPLQVIAQQVQKTPGEVQQELNYFQQIFNIFNQGQQNPFVPEQRTDNPTPQNTNGQGTQITTNLQNNNPTNPNNGNQTEIINVTITPQGNGNNGNNGPLNNNNSTLPDIFIETANFNIIHGAGVINGTPIRDIIFGSMGIDIIHGDDGPDDVFALGGDDIIIAGHGGGNDFYDGGAGFDTIAFPSATQSITFHLNLEPREDGKLISTAFNPNETGLDVFVDMEKVIGGSGNDTFVLHDDFEWQIDGGAGIDTIRIAGGLDFVDDSGGPETPHNIEILDFNETHQNTVDIDLSSILEMSPDNGALRVIGGQGDIINLLYDDDFFGGTWAQIASKSNVAYTDDNLTPDDLFDVYELTYGDQTYTVYVDTDITLNNAPIFENLEIEGSGNITFGTFENFYGLKLTSGAVDDDELEQFLGLGNEAIDDLADEANGEALNGQPTVGSAVAFDVWLDAGQTFNANWLFDANDYLPYNDFAFFSVTSLDTPTLLSSVALVGDYGQSGWHQVEFVAPEGGYYRIGFGVVDVGDGALPSDLYVANPTVSMPAITEDASGEAQEMSIYYIPFSDQDEGDTHTVTVEFTNPNFIGQISAEIVGNLLNGGDYINEGPDNPYSSQQIKLTYTVDNAAIQYLGSGQSITETVKVTLSDGGTEIYQYVNVFIYGADETEVPENSAPVVDLNGPGEGNDPYDYAATFTEDGDPISVVGTNASISDADDNYIQSATITLLNAKSGDSLTMDDLPDGIEADIDTSVSGIIKVTLTGSATTGQYQHALKAIYFANSSDDPDTTPRDISVTVSDGESASNVAHTTITVTAVNDEPTSHGPQIRIDDATTMEEGSSTTLSQVYVTDVDEGDVFTATIVAQHGTLELANEDVNEFDQDDSPSGMEFVEASLDLINQALSDGVIYTNPDTYTEGLADKVTLTVTDKAGNSDSMNFLFSVFGDQGATLIGEDGKDALFSTGHNDTLTGSGDDDTFVFELDNENNIGHDTITDFIQDEDKIAVYSFEYDDITDLSITKDGDDTVITFPTAAVGDVEDAIRLQGFNGTLTANDFIFHPGTA